MEKAFLFVFIIGLALVGIYSLDNQAFAVPTLTHNMLVLQYSSVCETAFAHDRKTDCPPLSSLVNFDTSNQAISGKFIVKDGKIIRTNPQMKNHWHWYDYQNTPVVCVECTYPGGEVDSIKVININPHGFSWIDPLEVSKNGSPLRVYSDIYISESCRAADIPPDLKIINDTITYMKNNCQGVKPEKHGMTLIKDQPWNWHNPFSSLIYKDLVSNIKKKGIPDCRYYVCDYQSGYKKW